MSGKSVFWPRISLRCNYEVKMKVIILFCLLVWIKIFFFAKGIAITVTMNTIYGMKFYDRENGQQVIGEMLQQSRREAGMTVLMGRRLPNSVRWLSILVLCLLKTCGSVCVDAVDDNLQ